MGEIIYQCRNCSVKITSNLMNERRTYCLGCRPSVSQFDWDKEWDDFPEDRTTPGDDRE